MKIFVDSSRRDNGNCGCGYVIKNNDHIISGSHFLGPEPNLNRAELRGIKYVLGITGETKIDILIDSRYCQESILGKNKNTYNMDLIEVIRDRVKGKEVNFIYVKKDSVPESKLAHDLGHEAAKEVQLMT